MATPYSNFVNITGSKKQIDQLLKMIINENNGSPYIDFNFIPKPSNASEVDIMWEYTNWGCFLGSLDDELYPPYVDISKHSQSVQLSFITMESIPTEVMLKLLAKFPQLHIEWLYADVIGVDCGYIISETEYIHSEGEDRLGKIIYDMCWEGPEATQGCIKTAPNEGLNMFGCLKLLSSKKRYTRYDDRC